MSSSSSQDSYQGQQEEEPMEWLDSFLTRTFFGVCPLHQHLPKNELNRYCIDCNLAACKYCIATDVHVDHTLLKIYRHVYKEVVLLEEMKTHIDCSDIQPYKSNKKMVISLNPLPHRGSGEANKDGSCDFCMRKLSDPSQFRYCSISCKPDPEEDGENQTGKKHRRKGNTLQHSLLMSGFISTNYSTAIL